MTLPQLIAIRLSVGVTLSVALSYGMAWPLSYMAPIFVAMFLMMPIPWIGWKNAMKLMRRLAVGLLGGLLISEYCLQLPLFCVPLYYLIFFYIFYNDATAPPMATLFMMLGVTMVPILGLLTPVASHYIVAYLSVNMMMGLVFMWLMHRLLPNSKAVMPKVAAKKQAAPKPPSKEVRLRLVMVSTIVAGSAVLIFFTLNLQQFALAMLYICMMAGTPQTNASLQVMKANSIACIIGGVAVVVAYNLLVAVPTYPFLIVLTLLFCLLFSARIVRGDKWSKSWGSGLTTFLVLLGSSTTGDSSASSNVYLRIFQVLFAGLFTIFAIAAVEYLIRIGAALVRRWRLRLERLRIDFAK
ncbi:DUF2955 domain-containing protein [Rubritalea marina]|uniref:DUF2955 domain-containing protein n=1 Tax=Rubritalea marina TaxID=361055 RepID=UPI000A0444C3|nr:DUF2955 domain-containing protein [Rubritalea marina]